MSELLWEIGCEEIPARMLPEAIATLQQKMASALNEAQLSFTSIESEGTPRRLMVGVRGLATHQPHRDEERRGPPLSRAFAADGTPTQAAIGFAQSCGVTVGDLQQLDTPKGSYLIFRQFIPGLAAKKVLPDLLLKILSEFPWPKSMRWGQGRQRFVRPLHRLLVILDQERLELATLDGLTSTDEVSGHRVHAPAKQKVRNLAEYYQTLAAGKVMLSLAKRREHIRQLAHEATATMGGQLVEDEGLMTENACLTEWPVAILGRFDPAFLAIPQEVLVTSMRSHQKYFAVSDNQNGLMPYFVAIANIEANDVAVVRAGYERVLRARLSDAAFFWQEDRKHSLADAIDKLKTVVFQERLGTVYERVLRLHAIAGYLADHLQNANRQAIERAAMLCKCDLVSGMVGEFPELQGVMGGYYALASGEEQTVATAIQEHYQPQGASEALPRTLEGTLLSLADKIDTLVGCFAIGLSPSGNKDPFALRRAAFGILRLLLVGNISLAMQKVFAFAYQQLSPGVAVLKEIEVVESLINFMYGRLGSYLKADGIGYDQIEAVSILGGDDFKDAMERIRALQAFKKLDSCAALVAANKRIINILEKSASQEIVAAVNPEMLIMEAEKGLHAALEGRKQEVARFIAAADYTAALFALSGLRDTIDPFFDQVLVMDPDPKIRANRLGLVRQISQSFRSIADVSRLVLSP